MPQLRHTAQARRDLLDIWLDIAVDNQEAANRVDDRLQARVTVLTQFPELAPSRPDIAGQRAVESPHLILYRILPNAVQIVRVLHGARDIDGTLLNAGLEQTNVSSSLPKT